MLAGQLRYMHKAFIVRLIALAIIAVGLSGCLELIEMAEYNQAYRDSIQSGNSERRAREYASDQVFFGRD